MDCRPVRVATRLGTHPPPLEGQAKSAAAEMPNPATPDRAPAHIGTYALPDTAKWAAHIAGCALAVLVLLAPSGMVPRVESEDTDGDRRG